ncbi:MAG: DUF2269 family protein [Spirochaetales bacterium]|nr:DUF2269 family protein [Spirochaetales bacterium]
MKTKHVLALFLALMAALVAFALCFRETFLALLDRPELRGHARFVHIAATTLFFANAALGMVWEARSLASGRKETILHTYDTVAWLDARFSSPLIVLSLVSGLMLAVASGDLWHIGWLSNAFVLFLLSGVIWVASDIPTQGKVRRLTAAARESDDEALPAELFHILKLRLWIGLAGVLPLVAVLVLMVYRPDIRAVAAWFR